MTERCFTQSELKTYKRCRRKWYLTYVRQLRIRREKATGAMAIGNRVHTALELLYEHDHDTALMWADFNARAEADLLEAEEHERRDLEKDIDKCRAMLEGYCEWLEETGIDEDYEVIGTEEKVSVPFDVGGTPVRLLGKLDQRVRSRSTGEMKSLDHKTVDDFSRVALLPLDEQLLHYHLIERFLLPEGERSSGGVINMLRKVKRTGNAKPPFYMREEIRHNDATLRAYHARVWHEIRDILELEDEIRDTGSHDAAYPNPTRDCTWDCPFFRVCAEFDDGSDIEAMLGLIYEVGDPLARYASGTVMVQSDIKQGEQ